MKKRPLLVRVVARVSSAVEGHRSHQKHLRDMLVHRRLSLLTTRAAERTPLVTEATGCAHHQNAKTPRASGGLGPVFTICSRCKG